MDGYDYLRGMLLDLHVESSPGDSRGMLGFHQDSKQKFILNLPRSVVESYIREIIHDESWNIDDVVSESREAQHALAELARTLEEYVTDDTIRVDEIGLRRYRGNLEVFRV